jgi:2-desacetyl-2-hydroxyethyl bacteriochlorophyllide A dehydrogenase
MKAAVLIDRKKIVLKQVPKPEPEQNEVLIKIILAGICGSDHSLFHGKLKVTLPVIPGHEAVGRIEKLGKNVSGISVGQRVTLQPNLSCGRCALCRSGSQNLCSQKIRVGVDIDGVFAEHIKVPAEYVWPIPDGVQNEAAVLAEPLAVAAHALKIMPPRKGMHTLILGLGVIGQMVMQLARLHGAVITACDLDNKRLALAEKLGAAKIIAHRELLESSQNRFDLIYETCGAPPALSEAIQVASPKGKIVLIGLPGQAHPIPTTLIVRKELQILGSIIYTDEFPYVLELLKLGRINTEPLVTNQIPLVGLNQALMDFNAEGRIKIVVTVT